jgi:6-phosphogluconolactonase
MNQRLWLSRFAVLFAILLLAGYAAAVRPQTPLPATPNSGLLFTETNDPSGNTVEMFSRATTGILTRVGSFSTQGTGTGVVELESQGAVALNLAHTHLYAVNAGSNDVTAFSVTPSGLTFINRFSSGGSGPNSLAVHGNLLYVLNAQGTPNNHRLPDQRQRLALGAPGCDRHAGRHGCGTRPD